MARLVALGWRRYGCFLGPDKDHPHPFFGLTNPNGCIQLLHLPDQAIVTIRCMIDHIPASLEGAITLHVHPNLNGFGMIEYASVCPAQKIGGTTFRINHRWITMPDSWWDEDCISMVLHRASYIKKTLGELCGLLEPHELFGEIDAFHNFRDGRSMLILPPRVIAGGTKKRLGFWEDLDDRCAVNPQQRDCIEWLKRDHDQFFESIECPYTEKDHELFLGGDDSRVHLYVRRQPGLDQSQIKLPIDFVTTALESQIAELPQGSSYSGAPTLDREILDSPKHIGLSSYYQSLDALAAAQEVFSNLPNAEVDLAVVSRSLSRAKWARSLSLHTDSIMSRASAVACICMFETGELNPRPEDLEDILAVSSSNNLYASEILFCDPSVSPPAHAFRHVIGNVGRPGLVLLLSPRDTILREPDLESWKMVNHAPFDGKFEDNFPSTSLHLSLTGYEQPVNVNDHGDRDSVVHFVEVVVSAHDRGLWHADLDLLPHATRKWSRLLPG